MIRLDINLVGAEHEPILRLAERVDDRLFLQDDDSIRWWSVLAERPHAYSVKSVDDGIVTTEGTDEYLVIRPVKIDDEFGGDELIWLGGVEVMGKLLKKLPIGPMPKVTKKATKKYDYMTFASHDDGHEVGVLVWNDPEMIFTPNSLDDSMMSESIKISLAVDSDDDFNVRRRLAMLALPALESGSVEAESIQDAANILASQRDPDRFDPYHFEW